MRKSALVVIFLVLCLTAMPGCQALLDLLGGSQPSGLGPESGPGGNVTVRLINQSGARVLVDAAYTTSDTQVRHTIRILDDSGPASRNTILATRTQFLDILAKVDPSADPSQLPDNLHPGDVLALGHFEWSVDFVNNDIFTFTIPAPNVPTPPADIIDCDGDGISDSETIKTCSSNPACADCDGNAVPDACDLASGVSHDCNGNQIPDECEIAFATTQDCNDNGVPDGCDIGNGTSQDCNGDQIPDECEADFAAGPDCNENGVPDVCDIGNGTSHDCNDNHVPDECEGDFAAGPDCNENGVSDVCDIGNGTSQDCNGNQVPDECDIANGTSEDCQPNSIPDECDIGQLVPAIIPGGGLVAQPHAGVAFTVESLGQTLTPTDLVNTLVGAGVNVSNVHFTGNSLAGGRFSGGQSAVGFDSGIVLSTGRVSDVPGPNEVDDRTFNFNLPGDADLDEILFPTSQPTTQPTHDAAVLEFDFSCDLNNVIQFHYVFASEEYNEYVDSFFNDVFAFFLNGENIAIVPGTDNTPVEIHSINCGSTPGETEGTNCNLFINNDLYTGQGLNTEFDGLTLVLTASAQLQPGTNHIKIAIADTSDFALDSAVLLQSVSFVCQIPRGACCDRLTNTCTDEVLESECQGESVTWSSGLTCAALDPPCNPVAEGGCCLPGAACLFTSEANCASLGGCFLGVESSCASATCTNGQSVDCDANGIPDECQQLSQFPGS